MPSLSTPFDTVREFFVLRSAERTVRRYTPHQHARVRAHVEAAEQRLSAARRVWQALPACVLLEDAVTHYLRARTVARDSSADEELLDARGLAAALPVLAPDPAHPDAQPTDDERVRAALGATRSLYLDGLSPENAARTRVALDRAAAMLAREVEARSVTNIRGTRWGRLTALAILAAYAAIVGAHALFWPRNIARGRPVHASSLRRGDGQELVDGELDTVPGIFTNTDESPSAVIDLETPYRIDRIAVYNRIDEHFDDCLPLVVELSLDGLKYDELGQRDQHFGTDPPWVLPGRRQLARYVRVRVAHRGYLALSEVQVYGKKP